MRFIYVQKSHASPDCELKNISLTYPQHYAKMGEDRPTAITVGKPSTLLAGKPATITAGKP